MTTFDLRTTAPSTTNKYYKHTSGGGVNECIRINGYSCLPNCVGYCWGAWYEMTGKRPNLSRQNARNWYGFTSDGYSRGQTPKLGAVACWGGTQYGHVAIVVGIHSDHITVSQSNYGGNRFEVVNCYKTATGYKSHGGNVHFQGFIYLPSNYTYKGNTTTSTTKNGEVKTYFQSGYANGKAFTTKVALNMRNYPSTKEGKVLLTIPKGKKCYYYGYYAIVNNVVWFYVAYGNKQGYVYGYELKEDKSKITVPYLTGLTVGGRNV